MRAIVLMCCMVCCLFRVEAQTKLIEFKSHSGNVSHFKTALEESIFGLERSNFGEAPMRTIRNAHLDSLIFLNDTAAVMVTSEICTRQTWRGDNRDSVIWKAGRDTVLYHPLFTQQHRLDSIQEVLDDQYHFNNEAKEVIFIGYDNQPEKPEVDKRTKKEIKEDEKLKKKIRKARKKLEKLKEKAKKEGMPDKFVEVEKNDNKVMNASLMNQSLWVLMVLVFVALLGGVLSRKRIF